MSIETLKYLEDRRFAPRLLTTILFILIYRFGSFIVLPGINPEALTALKRTNKRSCSLLDMFGGAFSNASILH